MAVPPKSDHKISLDAARQAIGRHRAALRAADAAADVTTAGTAAEAATGARGRRREASPYGFHAEAFQRILGQPGCVGIRAYPSQKSDGSPTLVLVGVDAEGNDMTAGELSDDSWPCPPFCPPGDGGLDSIR